MSLQKFSIMDESSGNGETNILINSEHIISVKPIKMIDKDKQVIDGFWLRLTNGKKYKATRMPEDIKSIFKETLPSVRINEEVSHGLNLQ